MQSSVSKVAYRGIETLDVSVQVHMSNGLPSMASVGLADKAVAESKERVRAALSSLGLALPAKRIAVYLSPADLLSEERSESTADVRSRILASREFAASRSGESSNRLNAHLEANSLNKELTDNEEIRTLYTEALEKQALSARGFHKSIRVARTIADLAASPTITRYHVLEALSYRRFFLFGADNG